VLSRNSHSGMSRYTVQLLLLLALICAAPVWAQPTTQRGPILAADVEVAMERLNKDPNLATTRQMRTLKWIKEKQDEPTKAGWIRWLGDLFSWIAEVSRVFVWLLIALFIGLLVLYLLRFTQSFGRRTALADSVAPTHVRDLDIRPESLPDDVGAAAWQLWQQGEHRAGLSLLYRGLLSRLAHVHRVPIRHSSTEGDCLMLAQQHLLAERRSYVAGLIKMWQRAVYGGADPVDGEMRAACDEFETVLRATAKIAQAQA
jgi:hypothetical protein